MQTQMMMLRVVIASLAVSVSACSGLIDELPTTPERLLEKALERRSA